MVASRISIRSINNSIFSPRRDNARLRVDGKTDILERIQSDEEHTDVHGDLDAVFDQPTFVPRTKSPASLPVDPEWDDERDDYEDMEVREDEEEKSIFDRALSEPPPLSVRPAPAERNETKEAEEGDEQADAAEWITIDVEGVGAVMADASEKYLVAELQRKDKVVEPTGHIIVLRDTEGRIADIFPVGALLVVTFRRQYLSNGADTGWVEVDRQFSQYTLEDGGVIETGEIEVLHLDMR